MLLFDLAPPTLQNSGIFFTIHPSSLPLWRFAAEIAAIRRLYIGLRVRYKYYKKHSRNWFGLEPPSRRSRSESAHKCIPYIGRDLAVPGPKTCFWVKTENGQALACPSKRAISDRVVSRSMQNDPYARCYREVSQRQRWNSEDRYVTDPTGGIDHARSAELTPVVRYRPSYEHRACRQQSAHSATELPFLPAIEVTPVGPVTQPDEDDTLSKSTVTTANMFRSVRSSAPSSELAIKAVIPNDVLVTSLAKGFWVVFMKYARRRNHNKLTYILNISVLRTWLLNTHTHAHAAFAG